MGFFSSLMDSIGDIGRGIIDVGQGIKRTACHVVGKAIEKVGQITRNIDIEIVGWNIQCNNPIYEKKVDLGSSATSVQDTIDIHRLCEETRQNAAKQAKRFEDEVVDSLEADINKFIDILAEVFPENILSEFAYEIGDVFEDDIHHTVSDYVAIHISQDSEEFVKILNMDDTIRAKKTDEYVKKVLSDALNILQEKCRRKKIAIYRKMCEDLEEYFENEKKLAQEMEKIFKDLQKHKDDMEFCKKQAISTVIDVAHMECIRTLTYQNV